MSFIAKFIAKCLGSASIMFYKSLFVSDIETPCTSKASGVDEEWPNLEQATKRGSQKGGSLNTTFFSAAIDGCTNSTSDGDYDSIVAEAEWNGCF
jgi:hypothetical protein